MKSAQFSNIVLVAVLTFATSAVAQPQLGTPNDNNDAKNVPQFEDIHAPNKKSDGLADALNRAGLNVKLDTLKNDNQNEPAYNTPEVGQQIADFLRNKSKSDEKKAGPGIARAKPRVLVTISKETTYITEPLRKDGYPDYVAVLNELSKKGVTPGRNSAVPFWKAIGPSGLADGQIPRYFEMLDMPPLPQRGGYFITAETWTRDHATRELSNGEDKTVQRPWSTDDFPETSKWLNANEVPLNLLVQASKRQSRYDPVFTRDAHGETVDNLYLPAGRQTAFVAEALVQRCMMRIQEGKVDEAWEDLLACHRLARLIDQGPFAYDTAIKSEITSLAFYGDTALLQNHSISAKKLKQMRADFAKVRPVYDLARKLKYCVRFAYLDFLCGIARTNVLSESDLFGHDYIPGVQDELFDATQKSLDFDTILRTANSWVDRIVLAAEKPTRRELKHEMRMIEKEVKSLSADARDPLSWHLVAYSKDASHEASKRIGIFYVSRILDGAHKIFRDDDQARGQLELTATGFALAAYRADHGVYPEQLGDLVPKYVSHVPADPLADDSSFHYKRQNSGYFLYSVGPDGKDDDGRAGEFKEAGELRDDISIRVP